MGVPPDVMAARLAAWVKDTLPGVLEQAARQADTRIGQRAISSFMRDAKGEARRKKTDRGPIRRLSGTLARATRGAGSPGAIVRVEQVGASRVRLTKGVDTKIAKGGFNEGKVARSGVSLSFLMPALTAETGWIKERTQRLATGSLRRAVKGTAAGSDA